MILLVVGGDLFALGIAKNSTPSQVKLSRLPPTS